MPSAEMQVEGPDRTVGGKKNKKQSKSKQKADKSSDSKGGNSKNLVDELKLFQNSNLLNQQDPIEQLQQQINQLIQADDDHSRLSHIRHPPSGSQAYQTRLTVLNAGQQPSLSTPPQMQHNHLAAQQMHASAPMHHRLDGSLPYDQDVFTVKKGVLWQQQNHAKFHQRLFSRWKKRYFILTTDYLVCFKRSTSRVGHSEMGKFLYKVSSSGMLEVSLFVFRNHACWLFLLNHRSGRRHQGAAACRDISFCLCTPGSKLPISIVRMLKMRETNKRTDSCTHRHRHTYM